MLAEELAELGQEPISTNRIKKVYIKFNDKFYSIEFDNKTLDEYGDTTTDQIFARLDAPLLSKAKLPDERTSNRQHQVYPAIRGAVIKNGKELVFESSENGIPDKLNKDINSAYLLEKEPLYKSYLKSKIIDKNYKVSPEIIKRVIAEFNSKYKNIASDLELRKSNLSLYLLPINAKGNNIDYKSEKAEEYSNKKSTKMSNAKFISVDDPAFSLNLQSQMKNLKKITGLNDNIFQKIVLNRNHNISGLYWQFFKIGNQNIDLLKDIRIIGIYKLFKELYNRVSDDYGTNGALKIVCFQQDQQKITILISENMSFPRFKKIAEKINSNVGSIGMGDDFLEGAFITTKGKKKEYSFYIDIIKTIIYESKYPKAKLIDFFMRRLSSDRTISLYEAIKTKTYGDINKYFKNNDYCIKLLCDDASMDDEQTFAFSVGKIAGRYIRFKRENDEDNNSLNSILQYSKYDAYQLKFVFTRISQGLGLSKIREAEKLKMYKFIKELLPNFPDYPKNQELSTRNDLAYFFYKGAFEELGG